MLEVCLQSHLDHETEREVFQWSQENLQSQLPIQPGNSASLTLYLFAAGDFLVPVRTLDEGIYPVCLLYFLKLSVHTLLPCVF